MSFIKSIRTGATIATQATVTFGYQVGVAAKTEAQIAKVEWQHAKGDCDAIKARYEQRRQEIKAKAALKLAAAQAKAQPKLEILEPKTPPHHAFA